MRKQWKIICINYILLGLTQNANPRNRLLQKELLSWIKFCKLFEQSVNSTPEHKSKLISMQVLHHCFSGRPRSPQRNRGKSYIGKADEALPLTPRCPESRFLSMNWYRRKSVIMTWGSLFHLLASAHCTLKAVQCSLWILGSFRHTWGLLLHQLWWTLQSPVWQAALANSWERLSCK